MLDRGYLCGLPRIHEPVEKVVVGPAGGPKVVRNKAETLRKRRFQPLVQRQKRARRSFSTRCHLPGTSVNKGKKEGDEDLSLDEGLGTFAYQIARLIQA